MAKSEGGVRRLRLQMQTPPDLIGRLAVHYKLISMDQLALATQAQSRAPSKRLGAILVELGFIDATQLAQLLEAQRQYLARQAQSAPQVLREAQAATRPNVPPPPPQSRPKPPPPREVAHNPQRVQWLHRVLAR